MLTARENSSGTSPHVAAIYGEREENVPLLDQNVNVKVICETTATLLLAACESGNLETVKSRLLNRENIECTDKNGLTPLLIAARKGHTNIIRLLLDHNANISARDKHKKTAILWAVEEQKFDALQVLLRHEGAKDLINKKDKYGNTALHVASKKGFPAIIKLFLLEHGANIGAKTNNGMLPLHLAAENGKVQCILELVKLDESSVNGVDEYGNTPLHLAAVKGHYKAVKCLIEARANIEARNRSLRTPLHFSAERGWVKSATVLIDYDHSMNPIDEENVTPLHLASRNGHVDMVKLFLKNKADVSLKDKDQQNVLDIAIVTGQRDVALAIIGHSKWKDAMRSFSTDPDTHMQTPLRKMIKLMPDVAEEVFNRCREESSKSKEDKEYYITFNYELLDDMFYNVSSGGKNFPFLENGRLSPKAKPYDLREEILKKNHPLYIMVEYGREKLFNHPLVISLLHHKWTTYGRVFYYTSLFIYLIFLEFFTGFILVNPPPFLMLNVTENGTVIWFETDEEVWEDCFSDATLFIFGKIGHCIIIALAFLNLFKEVAQLYIRKLAYFDWGNLLEVLTYILAIIVALPLSNVTYGNGLVLRYDWQWQCGAFGIFFAWLNLILFIQKFPPLGIYVVMFRGALWTFLKFFVILFLFIVSFALAFYILLMNQAPFHQLKHSLVKTFVMMIGDLSFDPIFHSQDYLTVRDLDKTSQEYFLTKLFYSGTTNTIFVLFAIIMSILIMNLLIGLAVGDIAEVQKQANVETFAIKVNLAFEVPMFIWRRYIIQSRSLFPNKNVTGPFGRVFDWFTEERSVMAAVTTTRPEQGQINGLNEKHNQIMREIGYIKKQMEFTNDSIEKMKQTLLATNESTEDMQRSLFQSKK